jgi:drug/metabolite transporter (DMT)-like permease
VRHNAICYAELLHRNPSFKAYLALAAVYFFWGTTYLGIRMSLESFPPLALVAIRFTAAGALLLAAARAAGARLPRGRELKVAALTGLVVLGVGNGALVYAETWIPSGLAALIITVSPFWMVGIEALTPGGERLNRATILAMLVGCAGAALLVSSDATGEGFGGPILQGFFVLQLGSIGWSAGSLYQRRQPALAHPIVTGAVQNLAAGLAFALLWLVVPEPPIHATLRGVAALVYLIIFGSIVGYSAYIYSLAHLRVAVASTYSYVNPVVAVFLGWLFYREPFGPREAIAMVVIFAGVALVKRYSPKHEPKAAAAPAGGRTE